METERYMTSAIIQVRMGSTRLPGKALLPIWNNLNALDLLLARAGKSKLLDALVVATTDLPEDDRIAEACCTKNVPCFRGNAVNVLERYYQCAVTLQLSGPIVRLTGDCPLHDAEVIDRVIERFQQSGCDYVANTHPPTYPDGLDIEVFSLGVLKAAYERATLESEREHVTYYIYTHPNEFKLGNVTNDTDLSANRWTLDEPADLEFIRRVYAEVGPTGIDFGMRAVLELLRRKPELTNINAHIGRNEGLKKSLEQDKKPGSAK